MRYVIDASVSVRWELQTPLTAKALRLRSEYEKRIHELLAPETIIWETANALIKAERRKEIRPGQAVTLLLDVYTTQPILYGVSPLVMRAMTIALQTRAGLYDCLYVVLAEREGCELITADDRLVNNLQSRFPFVRSLSSLP